MQVFNNYDKNHLTAFDIKFDASIFGNYSVVSKEFRVLNNKTLNVEEKNTHGFL